MLHFDLPERPKILVVTLRRLGDVLLTTPLVRTLRQGLPGATLDVLVFAGSERILKGNPDVDRVLTIPERPSFAQTVRLVGQLRLRYDLALCTQSGDRPTFAALLAGRRRVGLVPPVGGAWKRLAHDVAVVADVNAHRVEELLRLTDALGLARRPDLVCPQGGSAAGVAPPSPYAVLHPNPMYRYKRWNAAGWRALARGLAARGLVVVVTQGRDADENAYVDELFEGEASIIRERGRLDWAGLAALLTGAAIYVGPDTSVTHLAAGSGCPTVALYGPTSPCLVGPWPVGGLDRPWAPAGRIQRRGNVWLVQNPLPCLPCEKLGCDGHLNSRSQCLDELGADQVLAAVDQALELARLASAPKPRYGEAGITA
jgi:heptosyltransferase III